MGARDMVISFMVIGLFVFSMISFGVGIAVLNDGQSISDDPKIGDAFEDYKAQLNVTQAEAQAQRDSFDSEKPTLSFGEILFESIVGVGRTFTSSMVTFVDITFGLVFTVIFGAGSAFAVVLGVMTSIVLITIVFLLWRVVKAGE